MQQKVGRYDLVSVLGRGAMGAVYLAEDPALNRQVAIKMVDLSVEEIEQRAFLRSRLLRDAKAAALLRHTNIVSVYDILEEGDAAYVVMEYVPGESLAAYLERSAIPDHAFTLQVLHQVASALDYTHAKGIIHRDVKPGNVMCEPGGAVKILDFGIARMSDGRTSTPTGVVMGTIEYMSPEHLKGQTLDGRSDQFSMAAMAYRMLTGSTLFGQHTMATLAYKVVHETPLAATLRNASLPRALDQVLSRALAKLPEDRFSSCLEFAEALRRAFSGDPVTSASTHSPIESPRPSSPKPNSKLVLWIAGAAGILVVAGGFTIWQRLLHAPEPSVTHTASAGKPLSLPSVSKPDQKSMLHPEPIPRPHNDTVPTIAPKPTPHRSDSKPETSRPSAAKRSLIASKPVDHLPLKSSSPSNSEETATLYDRGQEQIAQADFAAAIRSFTAALAINPKLRKAYYSRGSAHQLAGENDAAVEDYSRAIQLDSNDALSYVDRAVCLVRMRRDSAALPDFNRALEIRPNATVALNGRGGISLRSGNLTQALRDFDAVIRINPQFGQAYVNRARVKRMLGDTRGAEADLKKALQLRSNQQHGGPSGF